MKDLLYLYSSLKSLILKEKGKIITVVLMIRKRDHEDAHGRSFLKGRSFSKGRSRTVIFERKDGHGRLFLVGRSWTVLFGRTLIGQVEDLDQGSQDQD
jgi:hypothetical protein